MGEARRRGGGEKSWPVNVFNVMSVMDSGLYGFLSAVNIWESLDAMI